jgi:hypothetical protein
VRLRPDSPSIYLPNSGQIDLNAIGVEAGQANNSQTALNDAAVRDMIGKASGAQNAMSEYYGASSAKPIDIATMGPSVCRFYATWQSGKARYIPGPSAWKGGALCNQATSEVGFVMSNENAELKAGVTYRVEFEASNTFNNDRWDDYGISIGLYTGDFSKTPMFEPHAPEGSHNYLEYWNSNYSVQPDIRSETYLWTMRYADGGARINDNGNMIYPTATHMIRGGGNWGMQTGAITQFKSGFNWTPGEGTLGVKLQNLAHQSNSGTELTVIRLTITPL